MTTAAAMVTPAVAPELEGARNVLVIKPSSLGDIVHTLPAVAAIKAAHPQAAIRWVANTEWVPLLRGNTDLRSVIPFPRSGMRGVFAFAKFLSWSRVLREPEAPDLVLDFQGLLRSGLMAKRSRGRFVVGLRDAREGAGWFHHRKIEVDPEAHAIDRYLDVARELGARVPDDDAKLSFKLPRARPEVDLPDHYVLLHPFSRGEGKSLTPDVVCRFCEVLGDTPVVIVGRGGPDLSGSLPANTQNLIGHTELAELTWLMANAEFNVSVDSGPAHIAAAVGEQLLAIHSWSDPLKVGPFRRRAWVWKDGKIARAGEIDTELAGRGDSCMPDLAAIETIGAHVGLQTH